MNDAAGRGVGPTDPVTVISMEDPAIDREETGDLALVEYGTQRDDEARQKLKFHAGERAVEITLRPVTQPQLRKFVNVVNDPEERWARALRCALERVDHHPDHPGAFVPRRRKTREVGELVDEDTLIELMGYVPGAYEEMGKLAYDRAYIPKGQKKGCVPPPGSFSRLAAWGRAAEMSTRPTTTLETTQKSDSGSEPPGNATAPESNGAAP